MLGAVSALFAMAPTLRAAVVALILALRDEDPVAARRALEAALRVQFEARQALKK